MSNAPAYSVELPGYETHSRREPGLAREEGRVEGRYETQSKRVPRVEGGCWGQFHRFTAAATGTGGVDGLRFTEAAAGAGGADGEGGGPRVREPGREDSP